jgi:predicted PurR-regulated permease PerM
MTLTWSSKKVFYSLGAVVLIFGIMYIAKGMLIPLAFAILGLVILYPISRWFEKKGINHLFSSILTVIIAVLIVLGIIALFSTQVANVVGDIQNFSGKLTDTLKNLINSLNQILPEGAEIDRTRLLERGKQFLFESGGPIISETIGFTGEFVSGALITLIYLFFILFYLRRIVEALTLLVEEEQRKKFREMLASIQKVGQEYVTGILTLIIILGILYSIALSIFGLDYPILFGFLAAIMAIVPYIGTATGVLIPVAYAFFTFDSMLLPLGILLTFWGIQIVEGNFLTPKIVGGSMHINALAAIFALILGGFIWGIAGMILFLPLMAMFRIVCRYYKGLHPLAKLIGED